MNAMDVGRFIEFAQRIMDVSDKERQYKGIENLQQRIVADIPDVISACTDLINENSTLRFGDYRQDIGLIIHYNSIHYKCIRLLTNHFNDVREYENDTEEKRAERKQKLEEYSSTVTIKLPPKEVIRSSSGVTVIERDPDPNLIYCLHGTYRQYSELCHSFEYRLCRTIQESSSGDLKTLYQKVCLYIALKNEKAITADELTLLGMLPCSDEPGNTVVVNKSNEKNINEEALKGYFIATFKGMGNNLNYFDHLIEDIKKIQNAKDAARAALVIYKSDKMSKAKKPNNFNQWYKLFCDMTGCKYSGNYKESKLDTAQMKTRLYYL